jgi:hypothetical protein
VAQKFGKDVIDLKLTPISLGSGRVEIVVEWYGAIIAVVISKTDGEY